MLYTKVIVEHKNYNFVHWFYSGNNGGYFESGDNRNDYNRQKDNYRGNRRQPPGGVTHFRGGVGSEQPIHQAFTTPPPNFTRASSSGGGFGSNSITNGGFSAGGGTGQNSSFQNHQLNLKEGDKVMAKYWEVNNCIFCLTPTLCKLKPLADPTLNTPNNIFKYSFSKRSKWCFPVYYFVTIKTFLQLFFLRGGAGIFLAFLTFLLKKNKISL